LLPALRFDYDAFAFKTENGNGNKTYRNINPSFHAKYSFFKDFFLKADIARQISRPPFNLMVSVDKVKNKKQLVERGNPELIPSTALNTGFGVEQYFGCNNYLTFRGFYTILNNVIETREVGVDDNYGYRIFQSVNVDSGLVWGLDANWRLNLLKQKLNQLVFTGNISWLGSEVRDPGTQKLRRLNEQPNWIANASLDYLNTKLKLQCSVGINPNDPELYPSDSFDEMKVRSKEKGFTFPYLFDEKQDISPVYGATKTPHIYLLKNEGGKFKVAYIGAMDDSPKDEKSVKKTYLADAIDALLADEVPNPSVTKAVGCGIKVKK